MAKGFLKSVFAPVAAGIVSGNVVWHGLSLLTTGAFAHGMSSTEPWINFTTIMTSMVAAGVTGYLLGRKGSGDSGKTTESADVPAPPQPKA